MYLLNVVTLREACFLLPSLCVTYIKSKRKKFSGPFTDTFEPTTPHCATAIIWGLLGYNSVFPHLFNPVTGKFPMIILALISGVRELSTHLAPSIHLRSRQ